MFYCQLGNRMHLKQGQINHGIPRSMYLTSKLFKFQWFAICNIRTYEARTVLLGPGPNIKCCRNDRKREGATKIEVKHQIITIVGAKASTAVTIYKI